jgi:hypothetical protein
MRHAAMEAPPRLYGLPGSGAGLGVAGTGRASAIQVALQLLISDLALGVGAPGWL